MIKTLIALITVSFIVQKPNLESSLNQFNGLSYIQTAEDLMSDGISQDERRNIEHLFVLASIVDPQLRNHSIIGLIDIEADNSQRNKLKTMIPSLTQLVVPSVVQNEMLSIESQSVKAFAICKVLTKIRKGQSINQEELQLLEPWLYLFDELPNSTVSQARRNKLSENMLKATLQVELQVLGGASVWSADYVSTNGNPVSMNVNEDLAVMYNVNPAVRLFKNGRWVKPD